MVSVGALEARVCVALMKRSSECEVHQTLSGLVQLPVEQARKVGRLGGSAILRSYL